MTDEKIINYIESVCTAKETGFALKADVSLSGWFLRTETKKLHTVFFNIRTVKKFLPASAEQREIYLKFCAFFIKEHTDIIKKSINSVPLTYNEGLISLYIFNLLCENRNIYSYFPLCKKKKLRHFYYPAADALCALRAAGKLHNEEIKEYKEYLSYYLTLPETAYCKDMYPCRALEKIMHSAFINIRKYPQKAEKSPFISNLPDTGEKLRELYNSDKNLFYQGALLRLSADCNNISSNLSCCGAEFIEDACNYFIYAENKNSCLIKDNLITIKERAESINKFLYKNNREILSGTVHSIY